MENWINIMGDQLVKTMWDVNCLRYWVIVLAVTQVLHLIGYAIHKHK